MSISNIYDNIGRQTARREQLEEEWQKQALQNAVLEYLPAYASRDNWRLGVELGEEVVIANVNEWQQKANQAAAQAEEYAQGAMRAETRGDMEVASILWGDSWSYDQKAQNYSAEAARYEAMRPNTAPTPVFTAPNTAPKPMSVNPAQTPKSTTPPAAPGGAATQGELAAGQEKAVWAVPDEGRQESVPASIHAGRIALEQDLNRLRSELQMYSKLSGGKGEPWILGWYADQIHDVMKAMEALPAEPVREDIFLQALKGNYYTGQPTPEGAAAQMALSMSGLDFPMDIRDLSYDLTHLKTVAPGKLAVDAAALLPFVGGLRYVDEAGVLWKQGLNAAEAAGDMTKQVDELVDAGGELVYNGAKQLGDIELMPADLMEELAQSGVKYTPEDVLMVTRNSDGKLMWLETGHKDAGLTHILQGHRGNLVDCGIEKEDVPSVIKELLETKPKRTGRNDKGPFSIYEYNGKDILIAYGDNGYIVSVYPVKGKK